MLSRRGKSVSERFCPAELCLCELGGELPQRERIAGGGVHQPVQDARSDRPVEVLLQQLRRGSSIEAGDREFVEPRRIERGLRVEPGHDHRHALGLEAPRREEKSLAGRIVDPVAVVDDGEHGPSIGCRREQAQSCDADDEPICGHRRPDSQCTGEGGSLWRGDGFDQVDHGAEQVRQPRKGKLSFDLEPARLQNCHPDGACDGRTEKRGLPCPGLAAQQQCAAPPSPRRV